MASEKSLKRHICVTAGPDMMCRGRKSLKRRKNSIWPMLPCDKVFAAITQTALLPALKISYIWNSADGDILSMWGKPEIARLIL